MYPSHISLFWQGSNCTTALCYDGNEGAVCACSKASSHVARPHRAKEGGCSKGVAEASCSIENPSPGKVATLLCPPAISSTADYCCCHVGDAADTWQVRGYLVRMHQSDLAKSQHKIIEAAIRIQNISLLRVRKRGLALSNFSIGANDAEPSLLTPRSLQKAGRQAAIIAELTCRLLVGLRSLEKVTVYLKNARMIVMRQGAELGFLPGFYGPPRDRKGSTASVSAGAGRRGSLSTFAVDFSQGPSVPGRRRSMHGKRRRSIVKAVAALKSEPTMHVTPEVLYKALKDNELFGDILVRIPQMVMMNLFQVRASQHSDHFMHLGPHVSLVPLCFPFPSFFLPSTSYSSAR